MPKTSFIHILTWFQIIMLLSHSFRLFHQCDHDRELSLGRLPCYVFCICLLTNKYQKYKSVELDDQLGQLEQCLYRRNSSDIHHPLLEPCYTSHTASGGEKNTLTAM